MTPLQAFATLGAAVNFGASRPQTLHPSPKQTAHPTNAHPPGGSALQSPLIMPMLQLPSVPAVHAGKMNTYLLHNSEHFFPPLNAACTVSNLVLVITAYLHRDSSRAAAEKLPYLATAFGLSAATTAYALLIMVPMNKRMAVLAGNLETNESDDKSEKELRQTQQRWTTLNLGMFR